MTTTTANLTPLHLEPAEESDLEKCRAFVVSQLKLRSRPAVIHRMPQGPAITISLQTGAGAHRIAKQLAELLPKSPDPEVPAWTVFDRQLISRVVEEHHLPAELGRLMTEDRRSYIQNVLEELLGLRPPSWVLVPQIAETILHLADAGHAIIVGRAANVITARMPNMFHVRIVGSREKRIDRVRRRRGMTLEQATAHVSTQDRAHAEYAKTNFHARVDDELGYHLTINTDRICCDHAARLIADAATRCFATPPAGQA